MATPAPEFETDAEATAREAAGETTAPTKKSKAPAAPKAKAEKPAKEPKVAKNWDVHVNGKSVVSTPDIKTAFVATKEARLHGGKEAQIEVFRGGQPVKMNSFASMVSVAARKAKA